MVAGQTSNALRRPGAAWRFGALWRDDAFLPATPLDRSAMGPRTVLLVAVPVMT